MLTVEDGGENSNLFMIFYPPVFHFHTVRVCFIHILVLVIMARRFFLSFFKRRDNPVTPAYCWEPNQLFILFLVLLISR
jgi:hypothetical protein